MAENDNEKHSGDTGKDPRLLYAEDEQESSIFRWMSAVVVLLAVAGFFGLAWYAYKSGGEAVDEKDVELIKADKSPVKETPANPGGMEIPDQDKTVYGLIGGTKTEKPTVERILPAPEEPLTRGDGTETWMSEKAKNKVSGEEGTEKVAEAAPVKPAIEAAVPETKKAEQFNPSQSAKNNEESPKSQENTSMAAEPAAIQAPAPVATPHVAAKPLIEATPETPPETKNESVPEKKAPVVAAEEKPKEPEAVVKPPAKGMRAQLGAYKSEAEAKANWAKIAKQFRVEVSGKEHYIIRADLGEKGVYYRLQIAPFASSREAEEFCLTFVSAGQNCFLAKAK